MISLLRYKPHLLYWICENCLCLLPGTCLPSRSSRMFPLDVWPATTAAPRWWSPTLSSVGSSRLLPHLAQDTKELIDQITLFEDTLCFSPTELIIQHCHIAHCTALQIDYPRVAMDTFQSEHNLAGLASEQPHKHQGAMPGNTEPIHNLTFLSHSLSHKQSKTTCRVMEIRSVCVFFTRRILFKVIS